MVFLFLSIYFVNGFLLLVKSISFRNLRCISVGSLLDCICRTFSMILGVRHSKFLDRSLGTFLAISTISVVVLFNVSFSVLFNILLLNETIRWRLFFPSSSSGKNIFPGLPRRIKRPSLFKLNFMLSNQIFKDRSLCLLRFRILE